MVVIFKRRTPRARSGADPFTKTASGYAATFHAAVKQALHLAPDDLLEPDVKLARAYCGQIETKIMDSCLLINADITKIISDYLTGYWRTNIICGAVHLKYSLFDPQFDERGYALKRMNLRRFNWYKKSGNLCPRTNPELKHKPSASDELSVSFWCGYRYCGQACLENQTAFQPEISNSCHS